MLLQMPPMYISKPATSTPSYVIIVYSLPLGAVPLLFEEIAKQKQEAETHGEMGSPHLSDRGSVTRTTWQPGRLWQHHQPVRLAPPATHRLHVLSVDCIS